MHQDLDFVDENAKVSGVSKAKAGPQMRVSFEKRKSKPTVTNDIVIGRHCIPCVSPPKLLSNNFTLEIRFFEVNVVIFSSLIISRNDIELVPIYYRNPGLVMIFN